jgi:hypothetical protein
MSRRRRTSMSVLAVLGSMLFCQVILLADIAGIKVTPPCPIAFGTPALTLTVQDDGNLPPVAAAATWDWIEDCPAEDCAAGLAECYDCGSTINYACVNWVGDTKWTAQGTWNIPPGPGNPPTPYVNSASVSCSVLGPDKILVAVNPKTANWSDDMFNPGPHYCVVHFTPQISALGTGIGTCTAPGFAERIWRSSA